MAIEVKRYLQGIKIILLAAGAVVSACDGAQWRVKCANEKATRKRGARKDNDESFSLGFHSLIHCCHTARTNFHNLKW